MPPRNKPWSAEDLRTIIKLRDEEGMSNSQIAKEMAKRLKWPVSRQAIAGLLRRTNQQLDPTLRKARMIEGATINHTKTAANHRWTKPPEKSAVPFETLPLSPAMRHLAQFDSIIAARMQREDLVKEPIAMDDDTAIAAAVSRMVAAGLSHTTISRELGIGLGRVAGIIHRNRFDSLQKEGEA